MQPKIFEKKKKLFVGPKSMTNTVFIVVFWLCQHLIYANNMDNLKQVSMLAALMHFNVTKNNE